MLKFEGNTSSRAADVLRILKELTGRITAHSRRLVAVLLATMVVAFATAAAHAQSLTMTASPTTYSQVGDVINYQVVISSGSYQLTSINTPIFTSIKNAEITCPPLPDPGGVLEPGNQHICTGSYTVQDSPDMQSGQFSDFVTITGIRNGGNTWNASSSGNPVVVTLSGGGPSNTSVQSLVNPTNLGDMATFQATVTSQGCDAGLAPTGTVTFTVGGQTTSPITVVPQPPTNQTGLATFSTNTLPVGSLPVSAQFTPTAGNCAASSGTGANHIVKSDTTTTLVSSLDPSVYGTNVTFTATVTPTSGGGTPTGNVTFTVDGTPQPPAPLDASGQATFTTSSLAAGSRTIGATYNGGTIHNSSGAFPITQIVYQVITTTALTSSQNPSIPGTMVTFTATVAPASGSTTPTGAITFMIDGSPEQTIPLDANGQATFATDQLASGNRTIDANYTGDPNHLSSGESLVQTVGPADTTTSLTSSANPSTVGDTVTFTATVTSSAGSTPAGTVTFLVDGGPSASASVDASGQATFPADALTVGTRIIGADYEGDATHNPSSASPLNQIVDQITTTTALASSANPSNVGDSVTFTATVTSNSANTPASGILTGTVIFAVDGNPEPPIAVDASGQAVFSTTELAPGNRAISVAYSGATDYEESNTSLIQTVDQVGTTTTVTSSASPSSIGEEVTFTVTVAPVSGGGTPTGMVTLLVDGVPEGGAQPLNNGQAVFSTSSLAIGSRSIDASYGGDTNYTASSGAMTQVVDQIDTTTALTSSQNPSSFGESVTFTATVTPASGTGTPAGPITFVVDGVPEFPVALDANGQATFSTNALSLGARLIQAKYSGATNYAASDDALTQIVNEIDTTTTLTSSQNPSSSGESVTFTATVTAATGTGTPTGMVTFGVDGAPQTVGILDANGEATFTTDTLAAGPHTITAYYTGAPNYNISFAAPLTQVVGQIGTTTTLASSLNPSSSGESVTFTATVTAASGAGIPTGSVTFTVDGTAQTPVALDGSGQASFSTSALTPGNRTIEAAYSGDASYIVSADTLTQTVDQIGTTTALTSSQNPSNVGDSVTFTATVAATSGGGTPTGTVTFTVGGTAQSPVPLDGSGQATYTTASMAGGSQTIEAAYSGDTTYTTSANTLTQTVDQIGTTTALASSQNPSNGGDSVTFTATVAAASGGGTPTPTGTVTFTVDGVAQPPAAVDGSGQASFATDALAPGAHTIDAAYSGDAAYTVSSDTLTQTVEQIGTTTALTSSQNPSNAGDSVTFVATVAAASGGGTPTGTITCTVDGTAQAPVALDGNGQASFTTDALAPGNRTIDAAYSGEASYTASTDTLTQTVEQIATTTALASSQNPSNAGDSVTFVATVAAASGDGTPTGTVTFTVDGTAQAPVALDGNGQASFATDTLAPGNRTIDAAYSGEAAYTASSDTLTQTVDQIGTTAALVSSANPSTVGETVTFTATIAAASGGGTPTGTVTFSIDGTAQPPVALDASGQASVSTTTLSPGSRQVEAAYGGDTTYLASSDTLSQTVNQVATTTVVTSSSNPSNLGESVSFTATVSPVTGTATPTGDVTFTIDGAAQPAIALSGGTAVLTTDALSGGDHTIVATYNGDGGHSGSISPSLLQRVRALGTVIIRQTVSGADGTFDFSSAAPELNLSITTTNGSGQSSPIGLIAGTYVLTAGDRRADGYALVGIACDDGDSAGNIEARAATINLAAGETVTCTFDTLNSADRATQMIGEFLEARGSLILAHQTDMQRRIDRLNGTAPSMGNPVSMLSAYLPGIVEGGVMSMSTSLAQVERLAGKEKQSRFDIWFEGTYGRFDSSNNDGKFAIASLGADYLVNRNLLVGAFFQVDHLNQSSLADASFVRGTGWLAGPYATARLSEHLFLDVLAAAGTSQNSINPLGTFTDDFDARRWLASAQVSGQWTYGAWTFSPRAGLSWFGERTKAYVDSLGVTVPSVDYSVGQIAFGPGVSYRHLTQGGYVIEPKLRLEGVAEFRREASGTRANDFHARIQAGTDIHTPGGASVGLSFTYSGIGGDTRSYGGKIGVSVPLN